MKTFVIAALALSVPWLLHAQGSFVNLNFESANLPVLPPGQPGGIVSPADAMPGWAPYFGTNAITFVRHNDVSIGAVSVSILGPQYSPGQILEGSFTAVLQGGANPDVNSTSASIAQTGLVPTDSLSLQFRVAGTISDFGVFLGGQGLDLFTLSSGPNYLLYGADISGFAGMTTELRFTSFRPVGGPTGYVLLDDIVFSPEAIPEPGAICLLAFGALLLSGRWIWRRKR